MLKTIAKILMLFRHKKVRIFQILAIFMIIQRAFVKKVKKRRKIVTMERISVRADLLSFSRIFVLRMLKEKIREEKRETIAQHRLKQENLP